MKILDFKLYEKLKIRPVNISDLSGLYTYFPADKKELKKLITKRIKHGGYEVNLNDIDTSKINDMSYLFNDISNNANINVDVSLWDVSKVTNMSHMFAFCSNFNCDLSRWNVSNVTNMTDMFCGCYKYNKPMNDWDVSNVTEMKGMFAACFEFNQPLDRWHDKISQVRSFGRMFFNCHKFDQDISSWKINKNRQDYYDMFIYGNSTPQGYYNVISGKHLPRFI